jgi:hypothetical protein
MRLRSAAEISGNISLEIGERWSQIACGHAAQGR